MRVGLTGHYASGKSTVSSMFEKYGANIIDTDDISREIVKPGSEVWSSIVQSFGEGVLHYDNTLNRKKLASVVFNNAEKLSLLNSLTHPPILEITLEQSKDESLIHIINVPLLFQAGYDTYMDRIIIVTTEQGMLIKRGSARDGIAESEAIKRIKSQNSINEYLNQADYIIENSSNIENTQNQVFEIWNSLITSMKRK